MSSDDQNEFGISGIWIPVEVDWHPILTSVEKRLFGYIQNLSKGTGGCYAKNFYLSMLLNVSQSVTSMSISNLKKEGFITIDFVYDPQTGRKERKIDIDNSFYKKYMKYVKKVHYIVVEQNYNTKPDKTKDMLLEIYNNVFNIK